jgi:hypothetical protein
MTAAPLVIVYCDVCGPAGSELATAGTAEEARRHLRAQGWQVSVYRSGVDRRLDFCPAHRT